jgi:hypothetical protein
MMSVGATMSEDIQKKLDLLTGETTEDSTPPDEPDSSKPSPVTRQEPATVEQLVQRLLSLLPGLQNREEPTFGCPTCLDVGFLLEKKLWPKTNEFYLQSTPCTDCELGATILQGILERTAEKKRPPATKKKPNKFHRAGTAYDDDEGWLKP